MSEKYPEVKPRSTTREDMKAELEKGPIASTPPSASFVAAQARASREARAKNAGMTVEQLDAAEAEKAQYLDALHVPPKKPLPVVEIIAIPKMKAADAAEVAVRLAAAEDEVKAAETAVQAAEEAERKEAAKRQDAIDATRRRLGAVQDEQRAVASQQNAQAFAERAQRLQDVERANRELRDDDAVAKHEAFVRHAQPLVEKLHAFLGELNAFAQQHTPALKVYASLTWQKTPAEWPVEFRTKLPDRVVRPATGLLNTIANVQREVNTLVQEATVVITTGAQPHEWLLGRLQRASQHYLGWFQQQLGVLNEAAAAVERHAQARVRPGVVPTVKIRERNPAYDPTPVASVQTGWDPHK